MQKENKSILSIPHDFEAEQATLGAIIYNNELINDVIGILTPNSFHDGNHRHIYRAMLELVDRSEPLDEILIGDQLKEFGKLEDIGGYAYLAELVDCVPSSGNIIYYAKIIQEYALLRDLITTSSDISRKSRDPEQSIIALLDEAEEKIFNIRSNTIQKDYVSVGDGCLKAFDRLHEISKNKSEITGLPTGFIDLDRITSGLQPSDLIILAARPSAGKTALALNIATYAATRNAMGAVLFFSFEMSIEQLVIRMLSGESRIDSNKFRNGNFDSEDWDKLAKATDRLSVAPIYINDNSNLTAYEVAAIAKKLNRELENGLSLIVLDYLQLMKGNKKTNSREQEVAEISRSLKGLAKDLKVPVIALSQLNRSLENRTDKRPKLSDLRESGCLHADTKIFEHNQARIKNIREFDTDSTNKVDSNEKKGMNILKNGVKMFKTGEKQFYNLILSTGHQIKATKNHKFLIPGRKWERLSELREGGMIGIPLNFYENKNATMNQSEIKLLALFTGNGCCLKGRSLQLTMNSNDDDLCEESMIEANKCFNNELRPFLKHQIYRKGTKRESSAINVFYPAIRKVSRKYRNPLVVMLEKYDLYDKRSHEKSIPGEIFLQPGYIKRLFIKYLWATDGTVCYSEGMKNRVLVAYSSSSLDLIKGLQILLQSVGILSRYMKLKKGKSVWYMLSISSRYFIEKFLNEIGIAGKRKNCAVEFCRKKIKTVIPGWTKYELSKNEDIVYVPIKEIVKDEVSMAYDLQVDWTHNFFANGIIVHNSIEQDSDIILFIYRDEIYNEDTDKKGIAEIIIAKHRNGPTGMVELVFTGKHTKFANMSKIEPPRQYKD